MPALVLSLSAAPAAAQVAPRTYGPHTSGGVIVLAPYPDTPRIREAIRGGRESGQLTRKEGRRLKRDSHGIDDMYNRFARDGLNYGEERELEMRAHALSDAVVVQRSSDPVGAGRK